jgi:DNA-directed RNA polymerase subunit M/transcription elongation factor TFIIS
MSGGVTRLISMKCPECGAMLPPREESGSYRCEFCESTFEARKATNVQPAPMPPQQPYYPVQP